MVRQRPGKMQKKNIQEVCQNLIAENSFTYRVINTWNLLHDEEINSPSVNSFKSNLNKHLRNYPQTFLPDCLINEEKRQRRDWPQAFIWLSLSKFQKVLNQQTLYKSC